MTTPRFGVAAGGPYDERWIAYTDVDGFRALEWVWDGGDHITVGAYSGELPVELRRIDVAGPDGLVIARTPDAFAAFLAGRYSTAEAMWALRGPCDAHQAAVRRATRLYVRHVRRRMWLDRVTRRRRARPLTPPFPG